MGSCDREASGPDPTVSVSDSSVSAQCASVVEEVGRSPRPVGMGLYCSRSGKLMQGWMRVSMGSGTAESTDSSEESLSTSPQRNHCLGLTTECNALLLSPHVLSDSFWVVSLAGKLGSGLWSCGLVAAYLG